MLRLFIVFLYLVCVVLVTSTWEVPSQPKNIQNETNKAASSSQADDELDLLFDPQLQCFYDPKTCKYYKLIM